MNLIRRLLPTSAASLAWVVVVPGARAADLPARKQRRSNLSAARLSLVSGNTRGEKPMKLGDKNNALAAIVVVAFAIHPGTARAEDIAAEIHLLKEEVKQLEPLKERLKQLEAEVAKEKRERKKHGAASVTPRRRRRGSYVRMAPVRRPRRPRRRFS